MQNDATAGRPLWRDRQLHALGRSRGSLVWMDNAVFASNRINDAFVLVSTRVIHRCRSATNSTDGQHRRQRPPAGAWVAAYYRRSSDRAAGPSGQRQRARSRAARVAVRQGSGLLLDFPIRAVVAASISLVDERGEPLPLGSRAENRRASAPASAGTARSISKDCKATTSYAWSAPTAGPARHASAWTRANPPSARSAR